ncbi:hypothetical protein J8I87_43730 [Paraburkholderia sp. LEh10]|uniref:hypothetical protein n=1 Tax=Paraburkholderia sp. LEh10 TaxID=2821353 RepID=UPI001AE54A2B|nr:hypothetical protein [Paraburkholderia sp. LEh10]MBP0596371.1 hypothetical protein [Paraburkholderia sp. LEh10]
MEQPLPLDSIATGRWPLTLRVLLPNSFEDGIRAEHRSCNVALVAQVREKLLAGREIASPYAVAKPASFLELPEPRLIEAFLYTERGLSRSTAARYLPIIRCFLDERFGCKIPRQGFLPLLSALLHLVAPQRLTLTQADPPSGQTAFASASRIQFAPHDWYQYA